MQPHPASTIGEVAAKRPGNLRVSAVCVRNQSAASGERSMAPLKATVITELSRDRVIVVQGRDHLTDHVG